MPEEKRQCAVWVAPTLLIILLCVVLGAGTIIATILIPDGSTGTATPKLKEATEEVTEPIKVGVLVDTTAPTGPFEHKWKRSFGGGHAALTLRKDWRDQLRQAVAELGLSGVRYSGMFMDDMGPVVPAPGKYNFAKLNDTWHFLVHEVGVRPVVELSYMPAIIAGCSWHGQCIESRVGCLVTSPGYTCGKCTGIGPVVNPGAPDCDVLHTQHQAIQQVPSDRRWELWHDLVKATVQFIVDTYGEDEAKNWPFEVWNEPLFDDDSDYLALYNASATAVKAVSTALKVGGPASTKVGGLSSFVQSCIDVGIPLDFVSIHQHPNVDEGGLPQFDCTKGDEWDPDCFARRIRLGLESVAGKPLYLSEYNLADGTTYTEHDSTAAAAFVFRTVGELNAQLELYSYWALTDLLVEPGASDTMPRQEFKNLYGMKTISGIAKPVWRAFQLLHEHAGDQLAATEISDQTTGRLCKSNVTLNASVTKSTRCVSLPSNESKPFLNAFSTLNSTKDGSLRVFLSFWSNPHRPVPTDRNVTVIVHHGEAAAPRRAVQYVIDETHSNAVQRWIAVGAPNVPNAEQLAEIIEASKLVSKPLKITTVNTTKVSLSLSIKPNSAVVVACDNDAPTIVLR